MNVIFKDFFKFLGISGNKEFIFLIALILFEVIKLPYELAKVESQIAMVLFAH